MLFQSKVHLYSDVPLSLNGNFTRYFANDTLKRSYFAGKESYVYDNLSYIRPDQNIISVNQSYGSVIKNNYLMFKNTDDSISYYCFITDVQYVSDSHCTVTFSIDPMMTYMNVMDISGFIEREHADYSIKNTLPEDVGIGDYLVTKSQRLTSHAGEQPHFAIITMTTDITNPIGFSGGTNSVFSHGIQQPYRYYFVNAGSIPARINNSILNMSDLHTFNSIYANSEELSNKIVNIQVVDRLPFPHTLTYQSTGENTGYYNISGFTPNSIVTTNVATINYVGEINYSVLDQETYTLFLDSVNSLDSSKLNHYPYTVVELSDGKNTLQFKPELFQSPSNQVKCVVNRSLESDCQVAYSIENYSNESPQLNRIIKPASIKLPVISTELSAYLQSRDNAYLTSSAMQIGTGIGMIALASATGGASMAMAGLLGASNIVGVGAVAGGVGSALGSTIERYKDVQKAMRSPNNVVGQEGTIITGNLDIQMLLLVKEQTPEYKTMIGNYFKVYGWKVLRNGKPNIKTRVGFNYVKMNECVVKGVIPQSAKDQIMQLMINGFTFWHSNDIGNYSISNVKG